MIVGRRDGSPQPAPEVDFPGQVKAGIPLIVKRIGHRSVGRVLALRDPLVGAGGILRLGKDLAAGDAEDGPCLQDTKAGFAEGQVLPIRAENQAIEGGIAKDRPPATEVLAIGLLDVGLVDPVLGHWGRWRAVVWGPNLEAVMDVIVQAGAADRRPKGRDCQRQRDSPEWIRPEHAEAFPDAAARGAASSSYGRDGRHGLPHRHLRQIPFDRVGPFHRPPRIPCRGRKLCILPICAARRWLGCHTHACVGTVPRAKLYPSHPGECGYLRGGTAAVRAVVAKTVGGL